MNKVKNVVKNRHGLSVVAEITKPDNPLSLVFLQHGVSGCKDEPHIQTINDTFYNNGYIVVSIDSSHGFGESEGHLESFTATTHYHDLEDVISWSTSQDFYMEPFIVAGHSMGGFSTLHYTINHSSKVKAVAPVSIAISGKFLDHAYSIKDPVLHQKWKDEGKILRRSRIHPERNGLLSWKFMEDFMMYDLLKRAEEIRVPVLLVVGENDPSTPVAHQQELFDILKTDKELNIVKNAGHSFLEKTEREEMGEYLDRWIKRINCSA